MKGKGKRKNSDRIGRIRVSQLVRRGIGIGIGHTEYILMHCSSVSTVDISYTMMTRGSRQVRYVLHLHGLLFHLHTGCLLMIAGEE